MGEPVAEMGSSVKKTLKLLCRDNGWSYGVFWRFDHRNSMLLTLEDAYYEEQMGTLLGNMLLQVHMLGEGVIGQAAFTRKHRWIYSDASGGEWNSMNSFTHQDIFQGDSEIHHQFSSGIKTIAVISVEPQGVVLFGSTLKILESVEFVDQTKSLFREMENVDPLVQLEYLPSSLHNEASDLSRLFASAISYGNSYNGNIKFDHGDVCDELGRACSSSNLPQSSPLMSEVHQARTSPECRFLSQSSDQLQLQGFGIGAQVLISNEPSTTQFQNGRLQSSSSVSNSATETPCISTWSSEGSVLTFHEPLLPSEMRLQDSLHVVHTKANNNNNTGGLVDGGRSGKPMDNQHSFPLIYPTEGQLLEDSTRQRNVQEEFKSADSMKDWSKCYMVDNLSELFSPSPEHSMLGASLLPSGLAESDSLFNIPANPVQSSITSTCVGEEKPGNFHGGEHDLFDGLGLDFGFTLAGECWEDIMSPVVSSGHSTISSSILECISGLGVGSTSGPRKGLFSELGLEELLNGIGSSGSVTKSTVEDQSSTSKRRRVDGSSGDCNQVQLASVTCSSRNMNSTQSVYNLNKINNLSQPKKPEVPSKGTRKRARPGESTRPRPKDRQQIQDRLSELRKIIPNGHKPPIDVLLDRTIKYMLFLQSVTKYADKLKQADHEPKMIDQGNGVVLKDNSKDGGSGGVTWAFEVGGQTLVCPIVVEDLNPPGQMLIEMLCEDHGFFLEIADIIRGFGLNILKGVMELRENKIWARFIVEANKNVTRTDIFWSLIQLLQQTATSGIDSTNRPTNAVDDGIHLFKNSQQPPMSVPVSLAETLQ